MMMNNNFVALLRKSLRPFGILEHKNDSLDDRDLCPLMALTHSPFFLLRPDGRAQFSRGKISQRPGPRRCLGGHFSVTRLCDPSPSAVSLADPEFLLKNLFSFSHTWLLRGVGVQAEEHGCPHELHRDRGQQGGDEGKCRVYTLNRRLIYSQDFYNVLRSQVKLPSTLLLSS